MAWSAEAAARWIAEAMESGNPLAPLPAEIAPGDVAQGAAVAESVLDALGLPACGVRLLRRAGKPALAGPMLEARLLPSGASIASDALRHPMATAAVVGVLAEPLEAESDAAPVFAALHPALDIAATRFTEAPADDATLTADLARLGLVIAGAGKAVAPGTARVALGRPSMRARGAETDLTTAFAEAAAAARAWGGLPVGALLVVAGLSEPAMADGALRASLTGLGGATAVFSVEEV
jgi:hypothetical protein